MQPYSVMNLPESHCAALYVPPCWLQAGPHQLLTAAATADADTAAVAAAPNTGEWVQGAGSLAGWQISGGHSIAGIQFRRSQILIKAKKGWSNA